MIENKPTIYNSPSIYKLGGSGGGGGSNFDFGQSLDAKVMPDGRTWATKNLILAPFPDGASGYADDSNNIITYGLMMSFYAVQYIVTNKDLFCPGWNVPTRTEFKALLTSCNNNFSTLNSAGFNIQLCGRKASGGWEGINTFGEFWTRTAGSGGLSYKAFIQNGIVDCDNTQWNWALLGVRLIKDE